MVNCVEFLQHTLSDIDGKLRLLSSRAYALRILDGEFAMNSNNTFFVISMVNCSEFHNTLSKMSMVNNGEFHQGLGLSKLDGELW